MANLEPGKSKKPGMFRARGLSIRRMTEQEREDPRKAGLQVNLPGVILTLELLLVAYPDPELWSREEVEWLQALTDRARDLVERKDAEGTTGKAPVGTGGVPPRG